MHSDAYEKGSNAMPMGRAPLADEHQQEAPAVPKTLPPVHKKYEAGQAATRVQHTAPGGQAYASKDMVRHSCP